MKRLVLVGGGHSHLLVLDRLRRRPPAHAEIVLVNPAPLAVYSGMIPGLIAGEYEYRACHIALAPLAAAAGACFIVDRAIALDPSRRQVILQGGRLLEYDLLSLDIGSDSPPIPGEPADAIEIVPAKPMEPFLQTMQALWARARKGGLNRMAVVGGGAAGVELALALHYRMNRASGTRVAMALVSDAHRLVPERGAATGQAVQRLCRRRGVALVLGAPADVSFRGVTVGGQGTLDAQAVIWATGAAAAQWIRNTGLATDAQGFVAINGSLQSRSHPEVFAAGDCASNADTPWPKSGVLAVRQGPVLAANLLRALAGHPLDAFRFSPHALAILNCGGRYALASWRGAALEGRWVWRWKHGLDRRFMRRFEPPRGR